MFAEIALLKLPLANLRLIMLATLCDRVVNVTRPPLAVTFVIPCKAPFPRFRDAVTTVLLSPVRKFPNWSSTRITGCCAKTTPAVAVLEGWARIVKRLAAAGFTVTLEEVTVDRPELEKLRLMVSAVL